jgi:hypothetical protein
MNSRTSFALAINERSEVVGQFEDAQFGTKALLWRRGEVSLIEIAGQSAFSAGDINDRREVLVIRFDAQGVASGTCGEPETASSADWSCCPVTTRETIPPREVTIC